MPTFELTGPDGAKYELDAPNESAALSAFGQFTAAPAVEPPSAEPAKVPNPNAPGALKSGALGVVQGATLNFGDEIGAGIGALYDYATGNAQGGLGEAYGKRLESTRGAFKEAEEANPGAFLAGQIGGGVATALVPGVGQIGAVARGASVGKAALSAAKGGALVGGASGFGAGEGLEDRLGQAAIGAGLGAAAGGALGAAGQALARGGGSASGAAPNAVIEAGERLGVAIPRGVASDSRMVQAATQAARQAPVGGSLIERSVDDLVTGVQSAVDDTASRVAGGTVRDRANVGGGLRTSIEGAVERNNQFKQEPFKQLRGMIDADAPVDVAGNLAVPLQRIARDLAAAGEQNMPREFLPIMELATRPQGATFNGLQRARNAIGQLIDSGAEGFDGGDLQTIYGALSDAMETAVGRSARKDPAAAVAQFRAANSEFARRTEANKGLNNLLRTQSDEGLADKVAAMATEGGRANLRTLSLLEKELGPDSFKEVAGLTVSRLGTGRDGQFSPAALVTNWNKLSPEGRSMLFRDKAHRARLEDIITVASRLKEVEGRFANRSNTGRVGLTGLAGAGLLVDPFTAITGAIGGYGLARMLSSPASTASAARWSRAYEAAVRRPTAATVNSLRLASRNLAGTLSDKLGLTVSGDDLLLPLTSQNASYEGERRVR